ncbi:glycosyltransferase [Brevundimonas sp. TWP2-3-2]|uniref:glycosyltransferase n=1 Tax=unclassified Brevundimonas TaxID=2622653 RepID=UPI003CEA82C7
MVAPEPPWPSTHGGRVDTWNRCDGLSREGWSVGLICWSDEPRDAAAKAAKNFSRVFDWVRVLEEPRGPAGLAGRLLRLTHQPSITTALHLAKRKLDGIISEAREFGPQLIVADTVYTATFARKIADALAVPLLIRSHNVEHEYMAIQYRLASSWRQRLSVGAARLHLKTYEIKALRGADGVLEISRDALPFWRGHGVERVEWVPTFLPGLQHARRGTIPWTARRYDAVYVGNLWSPNNVTAVRWLVDDVMPHVRLQAPDFVLMIAGSNPAADLQAVLSLAENVVWQANPVDAAAVRAEGRVLVNPILEGSGLNTKSIEMLFSDSPLVMTPFAAKGMDADTQDCFDLQPDPEGFAAAMVRQAAFPFTLDSARREARERFGAVGARKLSTILADVANRGTRSSGGPR